MSNEPDLEALRALAVVAEESSISAAGVRLGVSQQAVSLRIRSLERELRVRLLVRSARGSRLTPAGELVVGWATALLAAADEFSNAVVSLRTDRSKTMRIAASLTIAEHLLPEWIARWRGALGEDGPIGQLTAANSSAVVEAVRDGTADLGFIETPTTPADLGSVVVAHDTIDLVVQRGHRWVTSAPVSARELANTGLVLRELGSGTRQALEDALSDAGFPLAAEPVAVLSTTLGVRSAVMGGVAPGALSSLAVSDDVRAGRLVRIPVRDFRISRPLTAVWAGKAPPRAVREFLEAVSRGSGS
ncbi:LysR family transcriptional regulator [Streptomyces sulphureus]|uniref:LysR family transcriptional regulator n=1 Tax=Streptomyces sulphureus TaxID=47758 RepID=UPI000378AA48|nr:LysR family transcriptional regulator [Streptomyces sulphureus]